MSAQPTAESLYVYDATYLYALAANQSEAEGRDIGDGVAIFNHSLGRRFTGNTALQTQQQPSF